MTADGERAISGSSDTTLRVWDLEGTSRHGYWKATPDEIQGGRDDGGRPAGHLRLRRQTLRLWDLEGTRRHGY